MTVFFFCFFFLEWLWFVRKVAGLSDRCSQSTMSPAIMASGSRWSNGDISFWRDEWEADQQPAETSSCFCTHPRKRIRHNGVSSARAPSARRIIHRKTFLKVFECRSGHILQSRPRWVLKEPEASTAKLLSRCQGFLLWHLSGKSGPIWGFRIPSAMTPLSGLNQRLGNLTSLERKGTMDPILSLKSSPPHHIPGCSWIMKCAVPARPVGSARTLISSRRQFEFFHDSLLTTWLPVSSSDDLWEFYSSY